MKLQAEYKHVKHYIFHLHGVWYEDDGFVLAGKDEYAATSATFKAHFDKFSEGKQVSKSILFVGCGEGCFDFHFKPFLLRSKVEHYVLVTSKLENYKSKIKEAGLEGILFAIDAGSRDDLPGFLINLCPTL